jgi:hypothetical protein
MLRVSSIILSRTRGPLLCVFTAIILRSTPLHSLESVSAGLDLVSLWFQTRITLNGAFDFTVLFEALDILLSRENEQIQVLLKGLSFIYVNYPLFPPREMARLRSRILDVWFVRMFCHWNATVRGFFHHLLVYRVARPATWWHRASLHARDVTYLRALRAASLHCLHEPCEVPPLTSPTSPSSPASESSDAENFSSPRASFSSPSIQQPAFIDATMDAIVQSAAFRARFGELTSLISGGGDAKSNVFSNTAATDFVLSLCRLHDCLTITRGCACDYERTHRRVQSQTRAAVALTSSPVRAKRSVSAAPVYDDAAPGYATAACTLSTSFSTSNVRNAQRLATETASGSLPRHLYSYALRSLEEYSALCTAAAHHVAAHTPATAANTVAGPKSKVGGVYSGSGVVPTLTWDAVALSANDGRLEKIAYFDK